MNNKLIKIQEMLYNEMERLNDDDLMRKGLGNKEVQRSGALSQSVCAYIKSVNISLKIKEITKNNPNSEKTILKELGIIEDEK